MHVKNFTDLDESELAQLEALADLLADEEDYADMLPTDLVDLEAADDDWEMCPFEDCDFDDDLPGTMILMRCYMEDR